MGWALTALGVALVIVLVAGAALALCRRYRGGRQWGTRNIWSICEECRQRLSWLWAPREEKVGLVKAQHPTAQTMPSLYRQTGNTSQHLLHSDSDLRLDAQGAFTRFEPVDRDLHPPLGTSGSTIPPQPLRPAPQPRPTARPRPSPLQTASTVDYLRMQEAGPGPLTPPPSLPRPSGPASSRSATGTAAGPSVFLFQTEPPVKNFGPKTIAENIQMAAYATTQNHVDGRLGRYEFDGAEEEHPSESYRIGCGNPYREYETVDTRIRYGVHGVPIANLDGKPETDDANATSYGSYDIVQRSHVMRQHVRNDSRGSQASFGMDNSLNSGSQGAVESIYGSPALSKMFQTAQILGNDSDRKSDEVQTIEMTPFRSSSLQDNIGSSFFLREPRTLQKHSEYMQSLPDLPVYDSISEILVHQDRDRFFYTDAISGAMNGIKLGNTGSSPVPPPPPAPADPPNEGPFRKSGPTTGERIFSALRSVTSQSYIDASEFYNSVLSSAQVQRFAFPSRSPSMLSDGNSNRLEEQVQNIYAENDSDAMGSLDGSKRRSDLYSPELNLEAHRTAQQVYNSLQDPPSSPLLLKDYESYTYMSDPSFTRTSEDIFNSLGQRRKSMERLNGIHEFTEYDSVADTLKRRSSQDFATTFEESQFKRRLSQAPEPEPPPDESILKRAISCESVCSDTSVVFNEEEQEEEDEQEQEEEENGKEGEGGGGGRGGEKIRRSGKGGGEGREQEEEAPIVGLVCVGVEYDRWGGRGADSEGDLSVSVLEARDLVAPDGQPAQDTFARVCLLPNRQAHGQTRLYKGSPSPSYQEKFLFPLEGSPTGRALLIEVFSDESSMGGGASFIGEAKLPLGPTPRVPATTWLQLVGSTLPTPRLGELMFSLIYLPTAERLTLVVVKARNLRGASPTPGDFFVKVYLLQHGKKMHKKKTSVKKGEKSPIFNESIIFHVPPHNMQENIQLRLTVAELNNEQGVKSKPYSVGHILIGPNSGGKALAHWRQMLTDLRRPVAMWHPLRK